jgi:hypothetical protein
MNSFATFHDLLNLGIALSRREDDALVPGAGADHGHLEVRLRQPQAELQRGGAVEVSVVELEAVNSLKTTNKKVTKPPIP